MKKRFLIPLMAVSLVLAVTVLSAAATPDITTDVHHIAVKNHNTILISIDGLTRDTFYALLQKGKLPNIQQIVARGNYRNMDITGHDSETLPCYAELFTGYYQDLLNQSGALAVPVSGNILLFKRLKDTIPDMTIKVILTEPENLDAPVRISTLFNQETIDAFVPYAERRRSTTQVGNLLIKAIEESKPPYFLFANFTEVELMGHQYRQGGEAYSEAVQNADLQIQRMITLLKTKKEWENTDIILTTNYGFKPNSKEHSTVTQSWIAASFAIHYKGSLSSIVPTIYKRYKIDWYGFNPGFPGELLIY
ncbi:alkaline phosphatase family protein [Thermoproteota archaeon]